MYAIPSPTEIVKPFTKFDAISFLANTCLKSGYIIVDFEMNTNKNDFDCIKLVFCVFSLHKLVTCVSDMCVIITWIKYLFNMSNLTNMILISEQRVCIEMYVEEYCALLHIA